MSRKVNIEKEECIGCGSCHDICPEVFGLNEEIEKASGAALLRRPRATFKSSS